MILNLWKVTGTAEHCTDRSRPMGQFEVTVAIASNVPADAENIVRNHPLLIDDQIRQGQIRILEIFKIERVGKVGLDHRFV
jgi:hypothetical protein